MSLSQQDRDALEQRDSLTDLERAVIDSTMNELNRCARVVSLPLATDDRQCRVEAALIRLMLESRRQ